MKGTKRIARYEVFDMWTFRISSMVSSIQNQKQKGFICVIVITRFTISFK